MSGTSTASKPDRERQPLPSGAAMDEPGDRTGPYGGDDGAIEHEQAENAGPDTNTPEDTGSKVEPSRKGNQ